MSLPLAGFHAASLPETQDTLSRIVEGASSLDAQYLPRLLEFTVYAYELAPSRQLDWTVVVAQAIHESRYLQSPVSLSHNNTAGIRYGPNAPWPSQPWDYRTYSTLREGTADHVDLLAVYTGAWVPDMADPSRNTRVRDLVKSRLGGCYATHMTDLNGIWAWPGGQYGQNVERVWQRVFVAKA